jgi:uncharacterized protein
MFFHVVLTTECNLQCKYCFGESLEDFEEDFDDFDVDYSLPKKANYDFALLARLCKLDPDCVLTFYGGEPLLCTNEIRQIMDMAKPRHFMIQTNGLLLDRLEPEYVNRFHTVLVSVDGDEELTDYYRGKGTFRKVIDNVKQVVRNGFRGELIARMTVMEQTDIHKQVTWLLNNDEFTFSSVHWQLNAGFWANDYARRGFNRWSKESYVPGIANSLLFDEGDSLLRCGGGWINYAIQTDGYIIPCPTMWGMKKYYLDHISKVRPLKLKKFFVGAPCTECDVLTTCGGRCLYTNITKRWNNDAYASVCNTVSGLVNAVKMELPRINKLLKDRKVSPSDFEFMKYNGCEIIP